MYPFLTFADIHENMAIANLLILSCAVSVLIVLSLVLQKKKKFVWHGNAMMIVFIIAVLMTAVHMGYSYVFVIQETLASFNWVAFLGVIHGVIGLIALLPGIWLIGVWALGESSELRFCAPKKKMMWIILALWIVALALGLLYYPLHLFLT
jgi:hypothetical protein